MGLKRLSRWPEFQLQDFVRNQIKDYLSTLALDPERIILLERPYSDSPVEAYGSSLLDNGLGGIGISPAIISEIEKEFTAKHKFLIAHEIGHIIYDDQLRGDYQIRLSKYRVGMIAYVISLFAISLIIPSSHDNLSSLFLMHFVCCFSTRITEMVKESSLFYQKEIRADAWAAQQSSELAQGGISYFIEQQQRASALLEPLVLKAQNTESKYKRGVVELIHFFLKNVCFLSATHPSPEKRIAALQKHL
jgi:hypothetical protein